MSNIVPGHHRARAVEADLGFAGTGTEQIAINFQFLDGENAGQHITWYGFFTEKCVERTFETLRTCGWKGDDLNDLDGIDENEVELVVEMAVDERDGHAYPKVRWVNRLGGGVALGTRMTDDQRKKFAASMRGYAVSSRKGEGAQAQTQAPAPTPKAAPRTSQPRPANGASRSNGRSTEPTSLDDLNY